MGWLSGFLLLTFLSAVSGNAGPVCLRDWSLLDYFGEYSCWSMNEEVVDQALAKGLCSALQSRLAEANVLYKMDYIKFLLNSLKSDAWERGVIGNWLNADNNDAGVWSWESTSDFTTTDWYDESSIPEEPGYCLYMASAFDWQWDAMECSPDLTPNMLYVCEAEAIVGATHGSSHYTLRDFPEDLCYLDGGYLARIDSADENEFVKQLLRDAAVNVETWLGSARNYDFGAPVYIAGEDTDGNGNYTYINGDVLLFTDFADGEAGTGGADACIALDPSQDYQWVAESCGESYLYLCETEDIEVIG